MLYTNFKRVFDLQTSLTILYFDTLLELRISVSHMNLFLLVRIYVDNINKPNFKFKTLIIKKLLDIKVTV